MVPLRDTDDDQTVEIEQEQETELEVNKLQETKKVELGNVQSNGRLKKVDVLDEKIFSTIRVRYCNKQPYFAMSLYLKEDPKLREFADLFDGIFLTTNVLEWPTENQTVSDLKLLGEHRTPFHFLKIRKNGGVIILSDGDAQKIDASKRFNLVWGYFSKSGYYYNNRVSQEVEEKVTKIKFLNGDSSYSDKEIKFLEAWIKKCGKEKMLKFYEQHILAGFPEKAIAYNTSNLRSLFLRLGTVHK